MQTPRLSTLVLIVIAVLFVAGIVALVASSLVTPTVATHAPSPQRPHEVGSEPVGPATYTVDARDHDRWVHFDFSRGSVVPVEGRRGLDWDIGFQRHRMITNGGASNPRGAAAVRDLGPVPLDSAIRVPDTGYVADEGPPESTRNPVLEDWYDYSWTSHILRPADRTYAVRTADGRYAVLRFQGYYCPGAQPGCVTFRYRYRGDGGRAFP